MPPNLVYPRNYSHITYFNTQRLSEHNSYEILSGG